MHHVGCDELAHAQWKSRQLLMAVSPLFDVGETNCLQGKYFHSFYGTNKALKIAKNVNYYYWSVFFV